MPQKWRLLIYTLLCIFFPSAGRNEHWQKWPKAKCKYCKATRILWKDFGCRQKGHVELCRSTSVESGFGPATTFRLSSIMSSPLPRFCCLPWRWHGPDAPNEELFVLPYASACNRFSRTLPNFALCQRGPHVSTKESLANGGRRASRRGRGPDVNTASQGFFLSHCVVSDFCFTSYMFFFNKPRKCWNKRSLKRGQGERLWLFWPTLPCSSLEWMV